MNSKIKELSVNEKIRAPEVRVVNSEGKQLGIMPLKEAIRIAKEEDSDLVEVAPHSKPPVCKIMDFGKYKYQQSRKAHEAKKSQTVIQVKEVKIRPKTEEHDLQYKVRNIRRFLGDGNKAKVCVIFKGREIAHKEMGTQMLEKVVKEIEDVGIIEQKPKFEGRNMTMIIAPKP
ncbi:MAG: translation initiation factor IF-3 [Thermodesulfobacteriota bacterium]|nr:translation initiation factor IF-3 [Thermodesulfobacteriota bacterium]